MEQSNDERLWRIARKRAAFRKGLFSFLAVNLFMWALWWLTSGRHTGFRGYPWPVWLMLGWGLALGFQYFEAYNGSKHDMASEEYKRLKRKEE